MKDAAILFLLTFAIGLLVIMWREHRGQQLVVDTIPATAVACVPPMSHWQFKQKRIA